MAKKQKEIKCTAEYTDGCAQRLTDALVDIYYQRKAQGRLGEIEKYREIKPPDGGKKGGTGPCTTPH